MPRIGLTSTASNPGAPYVRAIERAGGEVVVLPNAARDLEAILATIDGVVVSGGVDVDPARYGGRLEHSNAERGEYAADRDDFEIALVRATRANVMPTLCICRGMQVANVAFGGTLIEDVRDELGPRYTIEHRQVHESGLERYEYAENHTVTVPESSAFARLVGRTSFAANSMHHQAVRTIGDGFVAVGRTSDGIVEALDATFAHPFFFAVQWHPEELSDAISSALFGGLVATSLARSAGSATR
ncbi:MAG: gamma-glutamyl-gamma-aminobutyrate hydrolase family protein [Vulcanimicrobiaceae bacterium]